MLSAQLYVSHRTVGGGSVASSQWELAGGRAGVTDHWDHHKRALFVKGMTRAHVFRPGVGKHFL